MTKPYELKNPIEVQNIVKKITDSLGMPIDNKMIRPLVILNSLGFETSGSCEGHLDRYNTYPWIDIDFKNLGEGKKNNPQEILFKSLYRDLEDFYSQRNTLHENKIVFRQIGANELTVRLACNSNLNIYSQTKEQKFQEQYQEISDFCEYLNLKYQLNF